MSKTPIADLVAPAVRELHPYVPGKPIAELEREYGVSDIIKLASNENPLGPGPRARAAMSAAMAEIGLYPDGSGFELKQRLARHHGLPIESITLGNGSNDILVLLAEAFLTPDTEAIYAQYCFAVYPIAVQAVGAKARVAPALPADASMPYGHDLAAMASLVTPRTRLVFIANPNNPTGTWLDAKSLAAFLGALPDTVIAVVDEAYSEYAREVDCPDTSAWLRDRPNLVVVRTFSKAHGLAGLRVGYALSQPQIAETLNRLRQPFNVNSLALAAATAALDDQAHVERTVALNRAGREQLRAGLEALGLRVGPSVANFVLVDLARPSGPVYEGLLRRGVIARPLLSYGMPNHLRITTGTLEQNQRALDALAVILEHQA
ncbi:MAG TPA: histidinol-phosphate transaminase [Steroidobacteraceae bacterium]|nr:histidinol-phosphate transaminase [Steroidobacteraceae bacterium]